MDLTDQVAQPRISHRPRRQRPAPPGIEPCAPRRRAPGRRPPPADPRPRSRRPRRSAFWAHQLLQKLSGAPVHRQLRLKRPNPQPGRAQLLTLRRAQPRQLTTIDLILPPPAVDRLIAHLKQPRDLSDRLPCSDQIQRPPTELRRAPLPSHTTSSRGRPSLETRPYETGYSTSIPGCRPVEPWNAVRKVRLFDADYHRIFSRAINAHKLYLINVLVAAVDGAAPGYDRTSPSASRRSGSHSPSSWRKCVDRPTKERHFSRTRNGSRTSVQKSKNQWPPSPQGGRRVGQRLR